MWIQTKWTIPCVIAVIAVIALIGITPAHNIARREPYTPSEGYAVLHAPRWHLSLLLDTIHKHITILLTEQNECYLLSLSETNLTALRLVVHIYRQGPSVLTSEFQIAGEVGRGWVNHNIGTEQGLFCVRDRLFVLLHQESNSTLPTFYSSPTTPTGPLIG